jgi:hypothetical protein
MRLTAQQRQVIREAGLRHFGVVPRPMRFCVALRQGLGDQKIDVVVADRSRSSIQIHAQQTGRP